MKSASTKLKHGYIAFKPEWEKNIPVVQNTEAKQ